MTEYNEHVSSNPSSPKSPPAVSGGNDGSVATDIVSSYMAKGLGVEGKRFGDTMSQFSQENNGEIIMLSKAASALTQSSRFNTKANGPNEAVATISGLQQ